VRIFGWLCDHNGCGHYRVKQPFAALRDLGYDATCSGTMPPEVARGEVDVILAQRVVLPGPTEWLRDTARKGNVKIVLEFDDDLFNIEGSNAIAHHFFGPEMQERAKANLAVADQVTTTTDRLADRLSHYTTAPIEVIPNHVNRWLTEHTPPRRDDSLTIGWAGSATHTADWEELRTQLKRFITRTVGVDLHVMGHNLAEGWTGARFTWWKNDIDAYLRTLDFHIGLAPLRPSLFNQSKSALKAIEYGALGIPIIASNHGPYADYVIHGETGFLVTRPHEWTTYLRALTSDADLRARMGRTAWEHVRATSVIEDNIWRWEKVLAA
jgi:glycosyltransferase involved in cell wall biosynthesis